MVKKVKLKYTCMHIKFHGNCCHCTEMCQWRLCSVHTDNAGKGGDGGQGEQGGRSGAE